MLYQYVMQKLYVPETESHIHDRNRASRATLIASQAVNQSRVRSPIQVEDKVVQAVINRRKLIDVENRSHGIAGAFSDK